MLLPNDGSLAVSLCYDGANCYDEMTEMSSHPDAERERYVSRRIRSDEDLDMTRR